MPWFQWAPWLLPSTQAGVQQSPRDFAFHPGFCSTGNSAFIHPLWTRFNPFRVFLFQKSKRGILVQCFLHCEYSLWLQGKLRVCVSGISNNGDLFPRTNGRVHSGCNSKRPQANASHTNSCKGGLSALSFLQCIFLSPRFLCLKTVTSPSWWM